MQMVLRGTGDGRFMVFADFAFKSYQEQILLQGNMLK